MKAINPIIHADFPDPDVTRAGDCYYMISTAMHMFPGGQILRSYDLTHWEHCTYVYDILGETARQRMDEGHIYGKGMWAASLKYARGHFHVVFTSNDTGHSYYFTAEKAEGPWTRQPMEGASGAPAFWYDPGLLFDDDDKVYVAHGNRTVRITELTADLSAPKEGGLDRVVLVDDNPRLGWEGSHFIKHDGWYYLFNIHWRPDHMRAMGCFRSRTLDGEFEGGEFMELDLDGRHAGVAQGGPVQLHDGSWALFLFQDHGAVGRIPVLVPMRWENDYPVVDSIPDAYEGEAVQLKPLVESASLRDGLSAAWQWNHEPHWTLIHQDEQGLRLTTDRVVKELTQSVNTLTQRTFGPWCAVEVTVDGAALKVGDYAGLCALQGQHGHIALTREASGFALAMTTHAGEQVRIPWQESQARLRACFDFSTDTVNFFYRDGAWKPLGEAHQLRYLLDHFMGVRAGLFCYATEQAGGSAVFTDFVYEKENR